VSDVSPEYPLARVTTWQNTAPGKNRTTGFTNPMALDLLSFRAIYLPISFKYVSIKGPASSHLLPMTSSNWQSISAIHY